VPRSSRLRSPRFRIHRSELLPADVAMIGPIRVTSALRTLVDLAAVVDERVLEIAIEDAVRRGLVSVERLRWRAALRSGKGYAGSQKLAALLARDQLGRTDSGWEVRVAHVLTDAGYPEPVRQLGVETSLGLLHVDLGYPGPTVVAFEYDSDRFHSGRSQRHRDVERRNALRTAGCLVVEVTAALVRDPDRLVALTADAFRLRAS
jgi:hypothetical protein